MNEQKLGFQYIAQKYFSVFLELTHTIPHNKSPVQNQITFTKDGALDFIFTLKKKKLLELDLIRWISNYVKI